MLNQSTHIKNFNKYPIWLLSEKSDSTAPMCTPLSKPKSGTFIMEEIWKEIEGFENYMISNLGRVYSFKNHKILKSSLDSKGYHRVDLFKNGKRYVGSVHRLVGNAFIPNLLNLPEINHKNGITIDNKIENLEWMTHKQNGRHARDVLKRFYNTGPKGKPVIGLNIKTQEQIKFKSAGEAGKNGFNNGHVSDCCNKRRYTHKGYKWQYETTNL